MDIIKARISVVDIDAIEIASILTSGKAIGDILDTVELLIAHVHNLPDDFDVHIETWRHE